MSDKLKPCCTYCEHTASFAGNYTECVLLHAFVDWYYWHSEAPDECPLERRTDERSDKQRSGD